MKRAINKLHHHNEHGFTLIEVTLALAVALIGMIAVMGLLPQGMQSARSAVDNTISATVAHDVFNTIRSQLFNNVDIAGVTHDLNTYNGSDTLNFDFAGTQTNATAYYKVSVNYQSQSPLALSVVTATVVWPALSAAPPNTNIFVTEVTSYN